MIRWVIALCIYAGIAAADDLPALFAVTGVAIGSELIVRDNPSDETFSAGRYEYDATGIEVFALSPDGKWGRVNADLPRGWVPMANLRRISPPLSSSTPLTCFGENPKWTLELNKTASFDLANGAPQVVEITERGDSYSESDRMTYLAQSKQMNLFVTIERSLCKVHDLSFRSYGLSVSLAQRQTTGFYRFQGCCTLRP